MKERRHLAGELLTGAAAGGAALSGGAGRTGVDVELVVVERPLLGLGGRPEFAGDGARGESDGFVVVEAVGCGGVMVIFG